MKIDIKIEVLSPIHLSSGQANVNVDVEVIHESNGLPYFPGKRFKGLLYESALEVTEMFERCGSDINYSELLEKLFHHKSDNEDVQLIVSNFYLKPEKEYEIISRAFTQLEKIFPELLTPTDVLNQFTSIRYQTRLENGVAADTSLHNMSVVNAGIFFYGTMELVGEDLEPYLELLAMATKNLTMAGMKRNRGFGRIRCTIELEDGRNEENLIESALKKEQVAI